jgi:hypothetical protein
MKSIMLHEIVCLSTIEFQISVCRHPERMFGASLVVVGKGGRTRSGMLSAKPCCILEYKGFLFCIMSQ